MDDRPERVEKERVTVTLTTPYLDGMDRLARTGIHIERQSVIRAALLLFLRDQGISPFYLEAED